MEENYQVKAFDMILDRLHYLEDKHHHEYKTIYTPSAYYTMEFNKLIKEGWYPDSSPVVTKSDKVIQNFKRSLKR